MRLPPLTAAGTGTRSTTRTSQLSPFACHELHYRGLDGVADRWEWDPGHLELSHAVRAAGGREVCPLDLYVRRLPPSPAHFRGQRVRQAYDDFAHPWRSVGFVAGWPGVAAAVVRGRWRGAAGVAVVAEAGRRRAGGTRVFPVAASLLALCWVGERATCSWAALAMRLRGGVPYACARLRVAAHSTYALRRGVGAARAASADDRGVKREMLLRHPAQ